MPGGILGWISRHGGEEPKPDQDSVQASMTPMGQCEPRKHCVVQGTIGSITVEQRTGGSPWLEATLSDASGQLTLVWMGRSEVGGVQTGRLLRAEGRVSAGSRGGLVIFNPDYTLL